MKSFRQKEFDKIFASVSSCRLCSRLVAWREKVAREKVKRFSEYDYWGKPVPAFGDPDASLLIVGLAPAAHGGNRTGRMFTGDRSGDWLYRALFKAGFTNQPISSDCKDGLHLKNCFITAICRCAPPQNKLLPDEIKNCRKHLFREIRLLKNVKVIVALGKVAYDNVYNTMIDFLKKQNPAVILPKKPSFKHEIEIMLADDLVLIGSFHPSQQNTFTGKLTEKMLDAIFKRVKNIL